MRIRVSTNIRKLLKRMMKLKKAGGEWIWIDFKYERLSTFCFIYGLLGHIAQQCPKVYKCPRGEIVPVYGHSLKTPTRRIGMNSGKRWLRQGPPESIEATKGKRMNQAVAMSIDQDNATISGVAFSKPFISGESVGNMALNMVVDNSY